MGRNKNKAFKSIIVIGIIISIIFYLIIEKPFQEENSYESSINLEETENDKIFQLNDNFLLEKIVMIAMLFLVFVLAVLWLIRELT